MKLIILILDLYIAAHAIWWFLLETNRAQNHLFTPVLSKTCEPFCRLFQGIELRIRGRNAAIAIPLLVLCAIRLFVT